MNIYYYTRTNTCERIAHGLAEKYQCQARQIIGSIDYSGKTGFIRGGKASISKREDPCIYKRPDEDVKNILLVTPVWAGALPPAVRTFVKENGRENIILVPVSKGSKIKDRDGYKKVIDVVGGDYK
ncbi:MAG: hypothetical protein J6P61_05390 [Erysipelotrichaceae bacterium]|nr:hypothetical protein [Erysipelotrichaceae bacterium]